MLKAMQLIPSLRDHIRKYGVTEKELEPSFPATNFQIPGGDKLLLIGWIAQRDPRPFWWSSEYADENCV